MSKTVKRVTTVMMIGLVAAMLGTKADAHYIVVGGKCFWHSGECVRKDKEVPPDPFTDTPEVELVARVTKVEILCPNNTVEKVDLLLEIPPIPVTLTTGPDPIVQGDITTAQRGGTFSTNLEVQRIVSDALFLENPVDLNFCSGSSPKDMIIREMSPVQMNLYCLDPATCPDDPAVPPDPAVHSAWRAEKCTLPDKFNFVNNPKNVPTPGDPFDCSGTQRCHIDDLGQKLPCVNL